MSFIAAILTNNTATSKAAMGRDRWSRLGSEARIVAGRGPSPLRASSRGRVKHLFGAN